MRHPESSCTAETPTPWLKKEQLYLVVGLAFLAAGAIKDGLEVHSADSASSATLKLTALLYTIFSGVNLLCLVEASILKGQKAEQFLPVHVQDHSHVF